MQTQDFGNVPAGDIADMLSKLASMTWDDESIAECRLQLEEWQEKSADQLRTAEMEGWLNSVVGLPADGQGFDLERLEYYLKKNQDGIGFPSVLIPTLQKLSMPLMQLLFEKASECCIQQW